MNKYLGSIAKMASTDELFSVKITPKSPPNRKPAVPPQLFTSVVTSGIHKQAAIEAAKMTLSNSALPRVIGQSFSKDLL
jgi:hypothetical protein